MRLRDADCRIFSGFKGKRPRLINPNPNRQFPSAANQSVFKYNRITNSLSVTLPRSATIRANSLANAGVGRCFGANPARIARCLSSYRMSVIRICRGHSVVQA
jgi:hypothetical protein